MEKISGFYAKLQGLWDFELFLKGKSHGPCPKARGPAVLSVHHGPRIEDRPELTGERARRCCGSWILAATSRVGRGGRRGPHPGWRWRQGD
jgi:hypothetical protein